jgi:hypothetical protein
MLKETAGGGTAACCYIAQGQTEGKELMAQSRVFGWKMFLA